MLFGYSTNAAIECNAVMIGDVSMWSAKLSNSPDTKCNLQLASKEAEQIRMKNISWPYHHPPNSWGRRQKASLHFYACCQPIISFYVAICHCNCYRGAYPPQFQASLLRRPSIVTSPYPQLKDGASASHLQLISGCS